MYGVTWCRSPIIRAVLDAPWCAYIPLFIGGHLCISDLSWTAPYLDTTGTSTLGGLSVRWTDPRLVEAPTLPACSTSRWEYGGVMDVMTVEQLWCFLLVWQFGGTLLYPHYLQSYPWGRSQVTLKRVGYAHATSACRYQYWYCVILHCAIVYPFFLLCTISDIFTTFCM